MIICKHRQNVNAMKVEAVTGQMSNLSNRHSEQQECVLAALQVLCFLYRH